MAVRRAPDDVNVASPRIGHTFLYLRHARTAVEKHGLVGPRTQGESSRLYCRNGDSLDDTMNITTVT